MMGDEDDGVGDGDAQALSGLCLDPKYSDSLQGI